MHDPSESKNGVSVTREKQVNFSFLIFYIFIEEILAVLINHFFIMGKGALQIIRGINMPVSKVIQSLVFILCE